MLPHKNAQTCIKNHLYSHCASCFKYTMNHNIWYSEYLNNELKKPISCSILKAIEYLKLEHNFLSNPISYASAAASTAPSSGTARGSGRPCGSRKRRTRSGDTSSPTTTSSRTRCTSPRRRATSSGPKSPRSQWAPGTGRPLVGATRNAQ